MKFTHTNTLTLLAFLLILAASCALFYGGFSGGHDWGGDFSAYIMQARSIVEHNPLEFIAANRFTIERSSVAMGPVAYPWGFPLMLAPVYAVFGLNLTALKLVVLAAYAGLLATLYFGLREIHARVGLLLLVALFAFNPGMLRFGDQIMADIPFLFLSTLSTILIWRTVARAQVMLQPLADQLILGVLLAMTCAVRSNGLLLLPVLACAQVLAAQERRARVPGAAGRRILVWLAPYVAFVLLSLLMRSVLPEGGGSYLGHLKNISLPELAASIRYNLSLPAEFFGSMPLYLLSIPFAILGIRHRWRDSSCILLYCGLTLALYIVWPFRQGLRFLFPILPFYISFALSGLEVIAASRFAAAGKILIALCMLLALAFFSESLTHVRNNLAAARPVPDGPYSSASKDLFGYLEQHAQASDVIVFRKPRVLRLMTGRPSIRALTIQDAALGRYLVMDALNPDKQLGQAEVAGLLASGQASLVHQNQQFFIYKFADGFSRNVK